MELTIQSRVHPYRVVEAPNFATVLASIAAEHPSFFLLVDRKVHDLHAEAIRACVPAERVYMVDASEKEKSYERLGPVFCWLLEARCRRNSHLVVVGGGVLQDIGCFVASVLFRGISWTLVPTTLLAQCDSCIGSKSSLNIHGYKNQLGTFYPPNAIWLVIDLLASLPRQDLFSGLGEAIKLHLIEGDEAFHRLKGELHDFKGCPQALSRIVWSSLRIKQRYIEEDELDRNVRNLLNYGHTFAHAFESATEYGIPHGIAVSLGVLGATFFSERAGWVAPGEASRLRSWLLPYCGDFAKRLSTLDRETVLTAMRLDKKNQGDSITFILTRGPGKMEKTFLDVEEQVKPWLAEFLE
jgi:3-dehydroquinate synthase